MTTQAFGRDQSYARKVNNELVIQKLRKEDLSATELSSTLNLSHAAMSSILKGLLGQGIIKVSCSKSEFGKGRKQVVYSLNEQGARALYMGIIGDTNRFMYRSTDERTFKAASYLLEFGINIEEIYQTMYLREEKDLKVTQFILNNYKVNDKVAYYILKDEDLKELGISREEGSSYVNTLANVKEFEVWCAITENTKDNVYRVSIRSRNAIINEVAAKFGGGGHALASGATLSSLDQLEYLLSSLHDAISMI